MRPDWPLPAGLPGPLCQAYDVALLDLDGVLYLGDAAVPGAPQALDKAADAGMRLAFVTNNSSRTPSAIAAQLASFGVPGRGGRRGDLGQAAATLLAGRLAPGAAGCWWSAATGCAPRSRPGLRPVHHGPGPARGGRPGLRARRSAARCCCEGALAVAAGAWYVAANADATMPTGRGRQPGNGALCQVIVASTGQQPVVAGKPEPPLHAEAVARTGARHPLVVGDRLDTDIEGGVRAGAASLLVFTGVSRPEDAVLAGPEQRPTYLAADLAGLLAPHPPSPPSMAPAAAAGGRRAARTGSPRWSVEGSGDRSTGCGRSAPRPGRPIMSPRRSFGPRWLLPG